MVKNITGNSQPISLKIGYLMQNGAPDLSQVSGPQLHTLAVINGLQKLRHSVRTIAIQNKQLEWSDDLKRWNPPSYQLTKLLLFRILESTIRRIQHDLKLPFLGLFDSLHFADACQGHLRGFDVLYERHGYMGFGGVIAAQWLNIPIVIELNGNILKEIDERGFSMSALQRNIGRWITIRTFLAADHMVVVSDALMRTLINDYHIPPEKISIVLNGVDIELFSRQNPGKEIRSQFGLAPGPIVGFVGSFEPWHGVELLVSSFQDVVQKHPDSQLVIIGEGPGKNMAVDKANTLGLQDKVKFLGRLPQAHVAALLGVSKVLVAPYPFEYDSIVGTPLKIMEYMAAGKGIVASTASIHEMIEHEKTGLRVAPANIIALADGINRLLDDQELCKQVGRNAAQHAKKYSWEQVNIKLIQIFREVINKKNKD